MKPIERSHIAIVISLLAIASSVWFVRFMMIHADAQTLKPEAVMHQNNLINPTNGEMDGSLAYDFTVGGDRSTYATIYLNDDGQNSDVLFANFGSPTVPTDSVVLGLIYSYRKSKGDDGFRIEYSKEGDSMCGDAEYREWNSFGEVTREKGKVFVRASLEGVDATQVCLRVTRVTKNEFDSAGYLFRDSNALNIYDVWLDTPNADVQMSALAESSSFALDETFVYHLQASNVGTGLAESTTVHLVLPEELEYVSAIPSVGFYSPVTGVWEIGEIKLGRSETLDVTVRLASGRVGDRVQATVAAMYRDNSEGTDESHATSTIITISETPSGIMVSSQPAEVVEAPEVTESLEVTEQPEADICGADCERTGFFLYIVNPDGTVRDTLSEYAKVTEIEPKYFSVTFEDKGGDFDFDDIAFELDIRDCQNVKVTETKLNAGWHHQVRANILYDGEVKKNVVIWEDSHEAVGQTKTYNLEEELSSC